MLLTLFAITICIQPVHFLLIRVGGEWHAVVGVFAHNFYEAARVYDEAHRAYGATLEYSYIIIHLRPYYAFVFMT